jgi:hypothetical protein
MLPACSAIIAGIHNMAGASGSKPVNVAGAMPITVMG